MQVNKYRARTIQEATAKVKEDLGPDAMILSTKKLSDGGAHYRFEITAIPPSAKGSPRWSKSAKEPVSEPMNLKEMICLFDGSDDLLEKLVTAPAIFNLYARLVRCGVKNYCARQLLEKAEAFQGYATGTLEKVRQRVLKEILNLIQVKAPFAVAGDHRIIAALVGTTGVGKTTTIAKLAAQLMLKHHKKVGLISIDTYRIGAMEQLKTYANILGMPCLQAFKRKDLEFALKRLEEKDVILIDTAGQSQYDQRRLEDLKGMLTGESKIFTHLLLSVGTSEDEMNATAKRFSALNYQSCIFTKTDEAKKCGPVLNHIISHQSPISYFTTGQNVPEDIEQADKVKILNLLFNKN
jgi:flagellar biosynthesis protein FlhF